MNLPRISLSLRNPIIRIVATFLIIATVALILLIYYIHNAVAEIPKANNTTVVLTGPISGKVSLVAKGALQYSNSKYIMEFARLHYAINNVANITATLNVYKSNPLPKIYLLNVQGYCPSGACLIGPITYASLNASLSKYGLILNKSSLNGVDISNIGLIPPGSIIIIPSGLMPLALLPNVTTATQKYGCNINSSASLLTLLSQGDTILYVGRNLTSAVTCSGQVIQTPYESALAIWGLVNDTQPAPQVNGTNSTGPLYLQNASFSYRDNLTFGTATGMQFLNGSFLVLPNYPSTGWADNYTFLASDIAKTLASRFWIPILAQGNISLNGSGTAYSSSYLTLFTTNSIILNSPTISSLVNSTYPLVVLTAKNNDTSKTFDVPVSINYQYKGTLSMPSVVGLGQSTQLAAEAYGTQSAVFAVAKIMDSNLTAYSNLSISFGRLGPTPVIQSFNRVSVPPGYYIANLTSTDGKSTYASTLFYVAPANITPAILGFENDTFVFSALSNGQQMDGIPYSININGAYNSTGTTNYGNIDYTLPQGTIIPYGNESFNIAMLGYHYNIPYYYPSPAGGIPSFYIEVAIELLVVLLIAKFIVPPTTEEYYIDVPDSKPPQALSLREPSDTIVDVFDKVNNYYHWKNMPLSVDEVRTGISNYVRYGSTRIGITARNAYAVLAKLEAKGSIVSAADYYAPKKWLAASNRSMEFLVIYRKLRDFCVANAMLFTELGSSPMADMIVTNKSTQNYIKIYTSLMSVKDLNITSGARVFISFLNEEAMQQFLDKLHSSYGKNAEILKMAISYGNITLIDTDHLERLKL